MNEVERIMTELQSIEKILEKHAGPSDLDAFRDNSAKVLLLAAASYFERTVCETILRECKSKSNSVIVSEFVKTQALERRYHTLFDWDKSNANKFFKLFGRKYADWVKEKVSHSDEIRGQIKDFLDVGQSRNKLVHNNYATFYLDNTYSEIWEKFEQALKFVEWLPLQFEEFEEVSQQETKFD